MSFSPGLVERQHYYQNPLLPRRITDQILSIMGSRHWQVFPPGMSRNERVRGDGFERLEGYVDRFGRAMEFVYEDLGFNGGRGGHQGGRVVDVSGQDYHNLDSRPGNSSYRPSANRYQRGFGIRNPLPQYYSVANDLGNLRVRSGNGRNGEQAMKFGKAMRELHRSVQKANNFYTQFKNEYDQDILATRKYATAGVLGHLWTMKVAGKTDQQIFQEGEDLDEQQKENMTRNSQKFEEMKAMVRDALQLAIESISPETDNPTKSQAHAHNVERLRGKVETAHDQIVELLDLAPRAREHCESLVHELHLLQQLINPDDDKNKRLYRDGGSDEGGSGAGDVGVGGGDAGYQSASGGDGWNN